MVSQFALHRSDTVSIAAEPIYSYMGSAAYTPSTNTRCGEDTSVQYSWRTPRLLQLNPIWSTNVYSIEAATRAKFIGSSRSSAAESITR